MAQSITQFLATHQNFVGRYRSVDDMILYMKGVFTGAGFQESLRALGYMQEHHAADKRRDGQPYIVHPLRMANFAISINDSNITDSLVATLLLHDVVEETNVTIQELPFASIIRNGVKYMSLIRFDDESKYEHKRRYYNELLESKEASICKGIDRFDNLSTMSASFTEEKIRKNVVETDQMLLPMLKAAANKWPEASNLIYVLRDIIRTINDIYALSYKVKLTDEHFVSAPDAKDYTYLLTGEQTNFASN